MYWLCWNDNDESPMFVIIYAAVSPNEYDNEYGYDTEREAIDAMDDERDNFYLNR